MSVNRENVRMVRLVTGEEVLGEVVSGASGGGSRLLLDSAAYAVAGKDGGETDTSGDVTLKNPIQIVQRLDDKGKVSIGMVPWVVYKQDKEPVTIRSSCIVLVCKVDDGLVRNYAEAFSEIKLPDRNIIMP